MAEKSGLFDGLSDAEKKVATDATEKPSRGASKSRTAASSGSTRRTKREDSGDAGESATAAPLDRTKLTPKWKALHSRVTSLYVQIGMVLHMADDVTGQIFIQNAEPRAYEWIELAQQDSRVEAILVKLTTGGAYGAIVMGHSTMLLALLARFGLLGSANDYAVAFTGVPVHPNFVKSAAPVGQNGQPG